MRPGEVSAEQVECLVCGKRLKSLNRHLKTHNLKGEQYQEMFPGALITSVAVTRKNSEGLKKSHREHPERWVNAFKGVTFETLSAASKKAWENPGRHEEASRLRREEWKDPEIRRKRVEPRIGQKKSQETKNATSRALKGRQTHPVSLEQLEKMWEARRGMKNTPEHRKILSETKTKWHADNPGESVRVVDAMTAGNQYFNNKLEQKMADILTSLKLEHEPQGRIGELNKPYRYHKWDFILREAKVAIEVDGCYWHGCPEHCPERRLDRVVKDQMVLEEQRDLEADLSNWTVLRFWEHEVCERPDEVADVILKAVTRQVRMVG